VIEPLDADDLGPLSNLQRAAVVEALFLVIAVDRQITPLELERFGSELRRIHWRVGDEMLQLMVDKARMRVKSALDREAWRSWLKEIALLIQPAALREKVVRTMIELKLAVGSEINDRERGLLNAIAEEFALSPHARAELGAEFRGKFHPAPA
jgi:Tellurite resistance protein TerB